MLVQAWYRDNYIISTDKTKLNIDVIYPFLSTSYWGKERTRYDMIRSINSSACFGLYDNHQQIGFARIVTDFVFFANLFDVFVLPSYRGKGLGKWLVDTIFDASELKNIRTWMLSTKDAHGLYEKVGFKHHPHPEWVMVRKLLSENH